MTRWPFWLRAMESFEATSARPPDLEKGATCARRVRIRATSRIAKHIIYDIIDTIENLGGDDDNAELLVLLLLDFPELRLDLLNIPLGLGLRLGLPCEQHVDDLLLLRGRRSSQLLCYRGLIQKGIAV
jgi:hypothetical protein